jgi:hypothetical protein
MENWALVLTALAAVLVGVLIPVLVQLRATLRAVEQATLRSGGRFNEALGATTVAAGKIDSLITRLSDGGQVEELVRDFSTVSRLASQLGDVARVASAVGAAVGPAVAAGIRALRETRPVAPAASHPFAGADFKHVHPQARKQATS